MSKPVIILGSGGHARVLLDMLRRLHIQIVGVTDPQRISGSEWQGCMVLGGDAVVTSYSRREVELVNGIGSLPGDAGLRVKLFDRFNADGYRFKTLVDPLAFIGEGVDLMPGVQVMAGVIIQAGTQIAVNSIVNSGAIVEHDCRIGCHVHIAPGAVLSGGVEVGDHVHIGTGAAVIQGIHIGAHSVIGAGSVVTRNVDSRQIVYPARSQIMDL